MFGRLSAVSTRLISKWLNGDDSSEMRTNLLWALKDLQSNIFCAPPRVIGGRSASPPVVIFTDGACEEETSIGGVLVLPSGHLEAFGAVVPRGLVSEWKSKATQDQVIGQAELYPVW
eukprot:8909809-Karenia_brevis.AAC.1